MRSIANMLVLAVLTLSPATFAQPKQSPERKAILQALRVEVQEDLRQSVTFKVDHLGVANGWAFISGRPLQKNGKAIDYTRTQYADAVEAGAFDDGIAALLVKQKTKWTVKTYVIGSTDVPWGCWWKEFGAPKKIFTYTETCD